MYKMTIDDLCEQRKMSTKERLIQLSNAQHAVRERQHLINTFTL